MSRKTVVITGASRGIGAAMARDVLSRDMNVAICARTAPNIDSGERVLTMAVDVSNAAAVQSLADETIRRFGAIDAWINNAGVLGPIAPLHKCDPQEVQAHLNINVMGVFHGTRSFLQHLRSREGQGVLINISSGAATSAYHGWGPYCAGKAAVDRMTEVAALEEKEQGLTAFAVAPGIIDTDMQALIRSTDAADFPMVEKFRELKRDDAFSSAEFVAKSIVDLAFVPETRPEEVCTRLPIGKRCSDGSHVPTLHFFTMRAVRRMDSLSTFLSNPCSAPAPTST